MNDAEILTIISALWTDISGDASLPARIAITGSRGWLPAYHPVEDAATATIAVALLAAAAIERARGLPPPAITVDRGHVAAAMHSGSVFQWEGRPLGFEFAPLSRFWEAANGWVRVHANYPWHRQALLDVLRLSSAEQADVAAAIRQWPAQDIERAVVAAGGVAAAVRSPAAWRAHPQGLALHREPLIDRLSALGPAPRSWPRTGLPARGVRVLDFTRVIAGPVCTRYLAALGASVLRIDPPGYPDLPAGLPADTLLGKRSALLDLDRRPGRALLERLLERTDIIVLGYRSGALDRFGLSVESLVRRHPGLVIVEINAWGHRGPWASRRGFDSIVQAAVGIAWREGGGSGTPGALPCQLLDHGTGYLAAAAALDGLLEQRTQGGTPVRRLSLARTAAWLGSLPQRGVAQGAEPASKHRNWTIHMPGSRGTQQVLLPVGEWNGKQLEWPLSAAHYAADPPAWRD